MGEEVVIRPFEESDLTAVLDVMRASLGEPPGLGRTPELFAWKHLHNPFGTSLMLVAEADGRIAGFRAFMRWHLVAPNGQELSCVRAVDTATHPDFQRRGIFRSLTMAGIDAAVADGVDMIFNTPNEKSGAGYLSMGWHMVGPVGVMARPGRGIVRRGTRAWPGVQQLAAEQAIADGQLDLLGAGHRRGLHTPRSIEYHRWRFAAHPTGNYVAAGSDGGVAVGRLNTRSGRLELVISELAGPESPQAVRLLVKRCQPDYIVGWFSAGTPEHRLAIRSGLIPVPRFSALTLVARPLRDLPIEVAEPASWDLSLGDLELL